MRVHVKLVGLLATTAMTSVLTSHASAQEAAAAAANAQGAGVLLGDVVVTATRQADTVNRVPLSISAVTQQALDQQGIKTINDLQRTVPALTVSGVEAGVATYSIRGIVQSGPVSATTGVYIDDVPLQKRGTQGVQQNNGTPSPPLFDLERVEVLRGPQGTLYGGSSEGGTVRFITPAPSLTRYSGSARAEVSSTQYGNPSFETGLALGGPIVKDKLGFRGSVYWRHNGGYIDEVDPYTGAVKFPNANSSEVNSYHLSLLWAPVEDARVTLSLYHSWTREDEQQSAYLLPLNRTLTTPSYCYNLPAAGAVSTTNPLTAIPCPATAVSGQVVNNVYKRPSYTYGPFNFGPFQNLASSGGGKSPAVTQLDIPSLTLEYNFPTMSVKSITSYVQDETRALTWEATQVSNASGYTDRNGNFYAPGSTVTFNGTQANVTSGSTLFSPFHSFAGPFHSKNKRWGLIQEIRFASTGNPKPLSWVGGVYFSNIRSNTYYELSEDVDQINRNLFGIPTSAIRYTQRMALSPGQTCASLGLPPGTLSTNVAGACLVGLPSLPGAVVATRDQRLKDIEIAAYGEANYWVTDKWKVTAGIRFSRVSFDYQQIFFGPFSGFNVPTVANTGITRGSTNQSPITPKVGLQYQVNENDMVYVTAAKGYREGGVNVPLPVAICGTGLALIGLTVDDAPKTYGSDTVWSYEGGAKLRLFQNRLQINGSVYRIDWSDVQLNVSIPGCGPTFIQNAGAARSEGFDVQAAGRLLPGLTVNLSVGYDKARYTQTATGPTPKNGQPATPVVLKGQPLPVPPWTVAAGLQYDFSVAAYRAYIRGDYQFTSHYQWGAGPGINAFSPDQEFLPNATVVNARAGVTVNRVDVNVFVNNVFNSKDPIAYPGAGNIGRSQCSPNTDASCSTFGAYNPLLSVTTFRPRTVGVQLNYKY